VSRGGVESQLRSQTKGELPKHFFYHMIVELGHIVTFTKVLRIFHSWIHPSSILPYLPFPHSWNSFNWSHFSIFIHEYKIFLLHSPAYTLSSPLQSILRVAVHPLSGPCSPPLLSQRLVANLSSWAGSLETLPQKLGHQPLVYGQAGNLEIVSGTWVPFS
jgi:hypothetical protein